MFSSSPVFVVLVIKEAVVWAGLTIYKYCINEIVMKRKEKTIFGVFFFGHTFFFANQTPLKEIDTVTFNYLFL